MDLIFHRWLLGQQWKLRWRHYPPCIGLKSNITLGIVIEIFGMILGILLCATLALYASVARLSIVELMIYIGFWVGATIIAELIKRP